MELFLICNNSLSESATGKGNYYMGVNILQRNLVQIFNTNHKEIKGIVADIIVSMPVKTKITIQMMKDKQFFLAYIYGLKSLEISIICFIVHNFRPDSRILRLSFRKPKS